MEQTQIYFPGVFDLVTHRHFAILQSYKSKARNAILIVGVFSDEDAINVAGNIIQSAPQREESIRACKWVDRVINPCPRYITIDFLHANRISFVCVSGRLVRPEEAVALELDYKSAYSELRATLVMAGRFIAKKSTLLAKSRHRQARIEAQRAKVKALEAALRPTDSIAVVAEVHQIQTRLKDAAKRLSKDVMDSFHASVAWAHSLLG